MVAVPARADDEEEQRLGPIGEAPFDELRLVPWHTSGTAFLGGCSVQLSQAAPLALLCEALAEELDVQRDDITILEDKRVLDGGMTVRENGIDLAGAQPNATAKLAFAVAGHPAVSRLAVRPLLQEWRVSPPNYARRPPLAEAPHLTTGGASSSWARVGWCSAYGPRIANEDNHLCCMDWAALPAQRNGDAPVEAQASFFVVCDGHGGTWISQRAPQYLADELREQSQNCDWREKAQRRAAVERSFLAVDRRLRAEGGERAESSGSTCVAAVLWPAGPEDSCSYRLVLANLGDSRGLLHRRGSDEVLATRDQKPDDPWEKRRIRAAGGFVLPADPPAPARLDGTLAMPRAFGDARFKAGEGLAAEAQKLSCLPEVYELTAEPGDMVVLACDGVFDVLRSAEVAALAARALGDGGPNGGGDGPVDSASTVVWAALQRNTQDNATCLVVHLADRS